MKSLRYIIILFLAITGMYSCTERIDIPLDDSDVRLVVDGAITTDTSIQTVILSSTSSYYYDQLTPRVSGAQVSISDGTQTFALSEVEAGKYCTDASVFGVPGRTYTLNIKLGSPIGGTTDYSAVSTLYPVVPLDSIALLFHPDWSEKGIWEVKCYVQEPPSVDFYRFLVSRNNVILTDSIDEWFVTDDKFFNGNYTNGATVAYLQQGTAQEGLNTGDTVSVEVNSIGKGYANFLWEAQAELRGSNPLFSGPPANVKGNITNGAVGYFAAYSTTRAYTLTPVFK